MESFHSHLVKFIPGNAANATHFQAYLLDGISQWNIARKKPLEEVLDDITTDDQELVSNVNDLCQQLHDEPFLQYNPPSCDTDELIGIEYLFHQCNIDFNTTYIDSNIESGDEEDSGNESDNALDDELRNLDIEDEDDDENNRRDEDDNDADDAIDSRGIPGWGKVDALAQSLIRGKGVSISNQAAEEIVARFQDLTEYDKRAMVYQQVNIRKSHGRYGRTKRSTHVGVEAMKRCFTSAGSPSFCPSKSRLVEAIFIHLTTKHLGSTTVSGDGSRLYHSRWNQIVSEYTKIRARVFHNNIVMEKTGITLHNVNQSRLTLWYKKKTRLEEVKTLLRGKDKLPGNLSTTRTALLRPMAAPNHDSAPVMHFPQPEDRIGKASKKPSKMAKLSDNSTTVTQQQQQPEQQLRRLLPKLKPHQPSPMYKPKPAESTIFVPQGPPPAFAINSMRQFLPGPVNPAIAELLPTPPQRPPSSTQTSAIPVPVRLPPAIATPSSISVGVSKTSFYRYKAKGLTSRPERKAYSCRKCSQIMEKTHGQYMGFRYCPKFEKLPYNEWKVQKKTEILLKKSGQTTTPQAAQTSQSTASPPAEETETSPDEVITAPDNI